MKPTLRYALPLAALAISACQTTAPSPPAGPDRFAIADTNHDGALTGAEWSDYVVGDMFASRDANKDSIMTRAEWNPQMEAPEAKLYNLRDANKDGQVSLGEACAHARKAGTYTADLPKVDTDKNGTVSRAEAMAYYASKEGPVR